MTDPSTVLARRLLLPELSLKKVLNRAGGFVFELDKDSVGEVCPGCAQLCKTIYDHRVICVKDAPMREERPVVLQIRKRRFECKGCKKIFSEPVPGILPRRRTTQRYRSAVMRACEDHVSLKRVCEKFNCSSSLVFTSFYEQLELRQRTRQNPWPEEIGIDEISFKRNRKERNTNFATVIVDVKNSKVLEIVQGKSTEQLKSALEYIPGRENVKWVVMDMCDSFRKFVREFFPNACIVSDKFHLLRLVTPSILTTLKQVSVPSWMDRRKMRSLVLSRPQNLDYFESSKLYRFLDTVPKLKDLYSAKEALFATMNIKNWRNSKPSFFKLLERLKESPHPELQKLSRTLFRWRFEILNYFQSRLTSGIVEGFNNKIKLVKRMAYGYRSFRNFRLRALNACAT